MTSELLSTHALHTNLERLRVEQQNVQRFLRQHETATTVLTALLAANLEPGARQAARQRLAILQRQERLVRALLITLEAEKTPATLLRYENLRRLLELGSLTSGLLDAQQAREVLRALDLLLKSLERIPAIQPAGKPGVHEARVARVFDGDTILLENGWKVRYIGMDAPEMHGLHRRPEPFAIQSRDLNARLVLGKTVRMVKDVSECDMYGRRLRYVFVGKTFVNTEMVRVGAAYAYSVPPDIQYAPLFKHIQAEAMLARRGMWAEL